jgi:4-amino-4-deoxy-L-arabinose transferase
MSASIAMFGTNVIAVRLVSIILSSLLILLIYGIGKELFNRKVGLISAFLFAINGFVLEIGSGRAATDHVDLTFLFFITLAIFFSVYSAKKSSYLISTLVGTAIGLAILSKWVPALIVLPIWLLLNMHYKNNVTFILKALCIIIVSMLLISIPWQWYILNTYPLEAKYEYEFNTRHFAEVLGTDESYYLYNLHHLRIKFGEYLYFPMIILCIFLLKKWRNTYNLKLLLLWIWIFVPLVFFSFVKTKMPGYILFTVPALYLMTAYVFIYFNRRYYGSKYFKITAFIVLFILPLRYTFERIKPFEYRFLRDYVEKYDNKTIIFNDNHNIDTMFFTDCYASYPYAPSPNVIDSLKNQGYNVIKK